MPFKYLQDELLLLDPVTTSAVARILDKFGTAVLITKAENALLNSSGYGAAMPADWDGSDPLARYKTVGIELIENSYP